MCRMEKKDLGLKIKEYIILLKVEIKLSLNEKKDNVIILENKLLQA